MLKFTFLEYDFGNTRFAPTEKHSLSFALNTERGLMNIKKLTTLTIYDADGKKTPGGAIDWKRKTIEIMGVTKPLADVIRKSSGLMNSPREWEWSGKTYVLLSEDWGRIKTVKSGEEIIAVRTTMRTRPLGKDIPATLTFHSDFPKEEMVFVMFAILYALLQLPVRNRPRTLGQAAGEEAAGAAATIATEVASAAVSSSCSIQ